MDKCANCGRRIKFNDAIQLCKKCAQCRTVYDTKIQQMRYVIFKACRTACVALVIAFLLKLFAAGKVASIGSMLFIYYAACTSLFTIANCVSQYIQMRLQLKRELKEEE